MSRGRSAGLDEPVARRPVGGEAIGQLMTVLAAYVAVRLLLAKRWFARARTPARYAVGVVAAYWCWQRIALLL